jgi:hypothetical protein
MRLGHHPQLNMHGAGYAQGHRGCSGGAAGGGDVVNQGHAHVLQRTARVKSTPRVGGAFSGA